MASKRTSIVEAIRTRFEGIVSGSTYQTNLGRNVHVWRMAPILAKDLPAVNVRDVTDSILDYTQASPYKLASQHQLTVEVEILVADSTDTITTIRKCLEDVELAIQQDETWGGLALRTVELSNEILASQERDTVAGLLLLLRVDFRTEKFKAN